MTTNELNPKDWNVEKEVLVRWGKYLYPAKILDISENEQMLSDKREELIKGSAANEECGRGRRKKKPVQYSSDDEQCEMPKRKKTEKKAVHPAQIEKLLQQRKQRLSAEKEPRREQLTGISVTHCSNCKRLEQRVKELEEDRQRLTQQVDTINDMRIMLSELRSTLVREPATTVQTTNLEQATSRSSSPQAQENSNDDIAELKTK
ncbi:uncharacterized protein [Paramormyrops kingsleyae]|uniref:uncharacterized protein isoform X2 n=1 Tax=Paramormyrops kingsleyae TaxID=1676925 RepID=UPI003B9705DB